MQIGLIRQVQLLFLKELKCEWRNRYAINGILVQVLSSVFICYLIFSSINTSTWTALIFLVLLFTSTNAIARSFASESEGRMLYYHQVSNPLAIFLSKALFNTLLSMVIGVAGYYAFKTLLGGENGSIALLYILLLFSAGTGLLLSTVSAISAKSKGGNILMPVLAFPLMIPLLLVSTKAGHLVQQKIEFNVLPDILIMVFIITMIGVLTTLLYKFLWQD